ncbi:hypothetical protein ACPOL_4996 [Acidisarcina polymorpha]|uniref:Uncharacterized protein n=1 Tax=Acidisarcina polymorpha TaxID=2211140 RepID=A0A2Z5G583_9BACT|nr:hypothetical protein ACPOL_4996 [Acidisarcina polymorpha]
MAGDWQQCLEPMECHLFVCDDEERVFATELAMRSGEAAG